MRKRHNKRKVNKSRKRRHRHCRHTPTLSDLEKMYEESDIDEKASNTQKCTASDTKNNETFPKQLENKAKSYKLNNIKEKTQADKNTSTRQCKLWPTLADLEKMFEELEINKTTPKPEPDAKKTNTSTKPKENKTTSESKPNKTTFESKPNNTTSESKPVNTTSESKPNKTTSESKPNKTTSESKPNMTTSELKQNKTTAESKPNNTASESKPNNTKDDPKDSDTIFDWQKIFEDSELNEIASSAVFVLCIYLKTKNFNPGPNPTGNNTSSKENM